MLPKVACPDLEVPDPEILGILATALPVPHDSAECSAPALKKTACPYLLLCERLEWTK